MKLVYTSEGFPYYIPDEDDPVPSSEDAMRLPVQGFNWQRDANAEQQFRNYVGQLPIELPKQAVAGTYEDLVKKSDAERGLIASIPALPYDIFHGVKAAVTNPSRTAKALQALWPDKEVLGTEFNPEFNDQERFKTWPEEMVRSGATLAGDVASGKFHVEPETPGVWSEYDQERANQSAEQLLLRSQDLAGMASGASLGAGGSVKQPTHIFATESGRAGAPISALEKAPIFYSAVEHAVQGAKQNVATKDQWLGYLRNQPGVKQEELDWVLAELPNGKITKQELEQHVLANKVELKEVNKQNYNREQYDEMNKREQELIAKGQNATEAEKQEWADIRNKLTINAEPKFKQYQLPGGENYREMLLQLPVNDKIQNQIDAIKKRNEHIDLQLRNNIKQEFRDDLKQQKYDNLEKIVELHKEQIKNPNFTQSHWDEPNILAHVRMNDRVIDGKKTLNIEEIQSDWHQKCRKEGYKFRNKQEENKWEEIEKKLMDSNDESILGNPELKDALKIAIDKKIITKDEAKFYDTYRTSNIPDAPFKQTWPDLTLKRMIRYAAENSYDAISWIPGEAQAARYDLSKQIKKLEYDPESGRLFAYDHNNKQVMNEGVEPTVKDLEPHIGKEPAEKLVKEIENHAKSKEYERNEWSVEKNEETGKWEIYDPNGELHYDYGGTPRSFKSKDSANNYIDQILEDDRQREGTHNPNISGLDLKVGGEGMKTFYDKMLVDKANAIVKKFGGKVEEKNLSFNKSKDYVSGEMVMDQLGIPKNEQHEYWRSLTQPERDNLFEKYRTEEQKQSIHFLSIPQQLKDVALHKGFPLFADSGKVGAPVSALNRMQLTPVDHNPFTMETYHGTRGFRGNEVSDYFHSTDNLRLAESYSGYDPSYFRGAREGAQILPLKIDTRNYHQIDANGKDWHNIDFPAIVQEAQKAGKSGIIASNIIDNTSASYHPPGTLVVTFPEGANTVRSKFAKFDPENFGKSGLLLSESGKAGAPLSALEKPLMPVIKLRNKIFAGGEGHEEILNSLKLTNRQKEDLEYGYLSKDKSFMDRKEAFQYAYEHNLLSQHGRKLFEHGRGQFDLTSDFLASDTGKLAPLSALESNRNVLTPINRNPFNNNIKTDTYKAAIRDTEGKKTYIGDWHDEAIAQIAKEKDISSDDIKGNDKYIRGYLNDKGKFLTEQQVENLSRSKAAMFRSNGFPIIPNKNLSDEDIKNLKLIPIDYNPFKTPDEQTASGAPLPTHSTVKPVDLPSKKALGLAALKAGEYGVWAARPALGVPLWGVSAIGGSAMNAASLKERRQGKKLGK